MNYRRNGKLQACEPCRKGKLRCDHYLPHCGRCIKLGKTDKCIYHPAPLSKTVSKRNTPQTGQTSSADEDRTPYRPLSGTGRASIPAAYLAHLEHAKRPISYSDLSRSTQAEENSTASSQNSSVRPPHSIPQPKSLVTPHQQGSGSAHWPSTGQSVSPDAQVLQRGASFINHTAVLDEHELSIGLTPPGSSAFKASQARIDQGASVIHIIRDLRAIQNYIDKWFSFAGGVVVLEPMVKIYLEGLWASWKHVLESCRDEDLRAMSAQVWNNTSRPFSQLMCRDTTAREFCTNVTGAGVRWEVIGLIVSLVSLVAQSLKGKSRTPVSLPGY